MATVAQLVNQGVLIPIQVELEGRELAWRTIYGTQRFVNWLDTKLPEMLPFWDETVEPLLQVDALLHDYIIGETLHISSQFHQMTPEADSIWMLKTADVRIFGWFVAKDTYIATNGGDATYIKEHWLYPGYVSEAARDRMLMQLDKPDCVTGEAYSDVVSDCP